MRPQFYSPFTLSPSSIQGQILIGITESVEIAFKVITTKNYRSPTIIRMERQRLSLFQMTIEEEMYMMLRIVEAKPLRRLNDGGKTMAASIAKTCFSATTREIGIIWYASIATMTLTSTTWRHALRLRSRRRDCHPVANSLSLRQSA